MNDASQCPVLVNPALKQTNSLKITLFGAAEEVTGSCFLLETKTSRILIDCGMFQGSKRIERQNKIPAYILSKKLDAVLLTHAHLDHCGRLPLLVRGGYKGPIYATQGSIDIAELIMLDAARIAEDDTKRENKRRKRDRQIQVKPLYRVSDVSKVSRQFRAVEYNQQLKVANGIHAKFIEAGHIMGSSSIELSVECGDGKTRKLVFSGDLGRWNMPILRDPAQIGAADLVFLESTYGDREHEPLSTTVEKFEQLIKLSIENKGKLLIPTFAVGRTQQILYHVAAMIREKRIPALPIYLDSPLAIEASKLYATHWKQMDDEAQLLEITGQLDVDLATLKTCRTALESKALNAIEGPCIILAGAGMCNAGRILHHMRHCLGDPNTILAIVGYQAKGAIGRDLLDGASQIKVLGETVHVKAKIVELSGFSAHAGRSDLLQWLQPIVANKPRIVLTHGECHSIDELAYQIQDKYGIKCEKPKFGDSIELTEP